MDNLPGPVTERLQISLKLDSEHPLTSPAEKYYQALVTGNLRSLQVLTDRYYEDVNLVFEISKNEGCTALGAPSPCPLSPGCKVCRVLMAEPPPVPPTSSSVYE